MRRPLRVLVVGHDEPTLALLEALRRSGPVDVTTAAGGSPVREGAATVRPQGSIPPPDVTLVGIDEAATHSDVATWARRGSPGLLVLAAPAAPDVDALDALGSAPVVLAVPALYAPALGRLLVAADAVAGPRRVAVSVALPARTAAASTGTACAATAVALALTVAAPASPVDVSQRPGGTGSGRVGFDDGTVAELTATTGEGSLLEVQVAGPDGTVRLELAPGRRLERDGVEQPPDGSDPLTASGTMGLASAIRAAATGEDRPPVRAGIGFAREVVTILARLRG